MISKKAQIEGIVLFGVIAIALIIFATFMMKVFLSFQAPMSAAFGNVSGSGAVAQANFNAVMNPIVTWWDKAIVWAFISSVIMLFISSFLIDTHPFFVIFYIFVFFILIIFSPYIMHAADIIYENADFAAEVTHLEWMDYIRNHYYEILLGIFIVNGIIMYGKIAFLPSNPGVVR